MYAGEDDQRDKNQLCMHWRCFFSLIKADNDWFELGLALGIQVDTLEGIESNKNSDKARLHEMLTHWLRSSPSRTWSDICNGLRSGTVQQYILADTIKEAYKGTCKYRFITPNTQNYCMYKIALNLRLRHTLLFTRLCMYIHFINRMYCLGALVPTTPHYRWEERGH